MVRGRLDAATRAQAIESIERNASLQAHLIEDLLDVSRIMTGKLRLMMRPVALTSIVAAAADAVKAAASARNIPLVRAIDTTDRYIRGDPDRVQQIVLNLLSNAIKFTPEGGTVRLALKKADGDVLVQVSDDGVGIPADFLPHVFERFRQADSSAARS